MLAIDEAARESWLGTDQLNVLLTVSAGGDQFSSRRSCCASGGRLAAFSGFYFAVAMVTDSTYREEFLEELTEEMEVQLQGRTAYLQLRSGAA